MRRLRGRGGRRDENAALGAAAIGSYEPREPRVALPIVQTRAVV